MAYWYSKGQSQYTEGNFHMAYYIDMDGYDEANYDDQDIEGEGENGDPFMAFGIDTQTWVYGQGQVEIGLLGSHRIRINSSGVRIWTAGDVWKDPLDVGTSYTDAEAIEATNWYYGYFGSGTTPRWLYVCSLPITTSGTLDQVHITMIGQSWTAGTVEQNYQFQNRSGFTYQWDYKGNYWNQNMNTIVVYDVGGRKDIYVKVNSGYIRFQLQAIILAANIVKGDSGSLLYTVLGKEQIANTWVTATPAGSLVFDASNTSSYPPNMHKVLGSIGLNGKITNLTNGSAATDAMAFGQKYTLQSHNNAYHSATYLDAAGVQAISINNVSEDSSPTLGANLDCNSKVLYNVGDIFTFKTGGYLKTAAGYNLYMQAGGSIRWYFKSNGDFFPNSADAYDIGSGTNEVASLWYCDPQDTTCADFSHYTMDELYNLFAQMKPMTDGGLHYSKASKTSFPHIDFKTIPDEFATKTEEPITKENVWENDGQGGIVKRSVEYNVGDVIAINAGNFVYAMKDLIVKQQEFIKNLESRIKELEK